LEKIRTAAEQTGRFICPDVQTLAGFRNMSMKSGSSKCECFRRMAGVRSTEPSGFPTKGFMEIPLKFPWNKKPSGRECEARSHPVFQQKIPRKIQTASPRKGKEQP